MKSVRLLAVMATIAWPCMTMGYEVETHEHLSERALVASTLVTTPGKLAKWGLVRGINDGRQRFRDSKSNPLTLVELVRAGARSEDDGIRPIHHFFNPANGAGLTTNLGSGHPSPDWVLGMTASNDFARPGLTEAMYEAYTHPLSAGRSDATGRVFEIVGRMIHHVQDMAQPQHVRNDPHLSWQLAENGCPEPSMNPLCWVYRGATAVSVYEAWTRALEFSSLPTTGYAPVYDVTDAASFADPRRFWSHGGIGLADFTNRNFFSAGTMTVAPPVRGTPATELASALCAGAVPPCQVANLDHGVTFYPSTVEDQFRTSAVVNPRAASESIYSPDFTRIVGGNPVLTVNRFTFPYAHQHLLPRAVGYSAGLINYLFRGEMEVLRPTEGVFAVVDTTAAGCGSPCGFRKVKAKVRNTTAGNEVMGPGALRAVAKFHRNTCYRADLAGMFGGDPLVFLGDSCRGPEEIRVSAPISTTVASSAGGSQYSFDFAAQPIPIDATDLRLQLVYRGRLGQEADAVAVTTIDIAEPNFLAVANVTDYAFDNAANQYVPGASVGELPILIPDLRFGFADPAVVAPVATLPLLSAGEHAQIAILADPIATKYWLRTNSAYDWHDGIDLGTNEFYFYEELAVDRYRTDCPVREQRGLYRQWSMHFSQEKRGTRFASAKLLARGDVITKGDPICVPRPPNGSGGLLDLSAMRPLFDAASARRWNIAF